MSAVASPRDARAEPALVGSLTLTDRLIAAVPLASIYVWLSAAYCIEAWKRVTPWLFTDELEMTQIARSIAATGHPARRGQPYGFHSLYTVLTAPMWLIGSVPTAYAGVKYLDVFAMTSVVVPTYLLARLVVGRRWSLFAAAGAGLVPAMAYSSYLVEEPIAYPYAALCCYLIAKALLVRSRRRIAVAVVAAAIAPAVRGELVVIPIVFAVAALLVIWTGDWARERRTRWSRWDWAGTVLLVVGAAMALSGILSAFSSQWYEISTFWKHRAFVLGDWAAGALAIGIGVVPLVAGLASLVRARGERSSVELRVFRCVTVAALLGFGLYTGMKAAYLANHFATRVEERNLIYICPLLFVGTALILERRRVNVLALAAACGYALYLLCGTPYHFETQLYSDSLGLAVLEQANRYFAITSHTAQWLMIGVLAAGGVVLLAVHLLRRLPALGVGLAALLALAVLGWNGTAELAAAAGTISVSHDLVPTLTRPFSWVDEHTHGAKTLYLDQGVGDQNPEWLLEFWNRSIARVSSTDGTVLGPGPSGAPNTTASGQIYWTNSPARPGAEFAYAVEGWPCIDFAGTTVATHTYRSGATGGGHWRLVELDRPNRLRAQCSGIYSDGWSGPNDSTYFRFVDGKPGWLRVTLYRQSFSATPVTVEFGRIATRDQEPVVGTIISKRRFTLPSKTHRTLWIRTPSGAFGAKVVIVDKVVPNEIVHNGDVRHLGAQIAYGWFARKPARR